ncbi:GAF domain-containing sensor histidine kinase [Conexibacter woesei]|uniref:sensor histidine kinase n=1 Tax=Conexibacter woesei TaxID=191495 RepID=UPI000412C2A5|nr:GAF domain-containing protein [Conexibacter woesei]
MPRSALAADARSLALRYHTAFNARDMDALAQVLDDASAITASHDLLERFPGVILVPQRTVAETPGAIVTELRLVNPEAAERAAADAVGTWYLGGLVHEIVEVCDGRITAAHRHYVAHADDRTVAGEIPSCGARTADEQAALRRLAELAARGGTPEEAFGAVVLEVSRVLAVNVALLGRYEPDGTGVIVAVHGVHTPEMTVGRRQKGGDGVVDRVWQTGRPSRIDDYKSLPGGGPELPRHLNMRGSAGVPIFIDGHLWGVLIATALHRPLAPGIELRLAEFATLLGTVIAGTRSQLRLRELAAEQAALRRVAELVARGVGEEELFASVADEASRLIEDEAASLFRVDDDAGGTLVAASSGGPVPIGRRVDIAADDEGIVAQILRTGRPARLDDYSPVSGRAWAHDDFGVGSCVAVPIFVDDRIWGVLGITTPDRELPPDVEQRLKQFADLIAAALANVQARAEVQQLADEQAALRRVAELAARGAAPEAVFDAVATEASNLVADETMTLTRLEADGRHVVVAVSDGSFPAGTRVTAEPAGVIARVRATRRPARVDGPVACVAVPITVGDDLWGVLYATARRSLPPATEHRLNQFAEIAAAAIASADARALLTASRARVVATADETRRRLQRDVHDGAQQQLVQTVITLKLASAVLGEDGGPAAELVEESLRHAQQATAELGDLVRGILPASLTRGGLRPGLESLVAGLSLPVDLHVTGARLAAEIETTAYFLVAEALTNVVKHARASHARVAVAVDLETGELVIDVCDDGVGGADPSGGTGLTGLLDRVEAGEGTLAIVSPPGAGTALRVALPVGAG